MTDTPWPDPALVEVIYFSRRDWLMHASRARIHKELQASPLSLLASDNKDGFVVWCGEGDVVYMQMFMLHPYFWGRIAFALWQRAQEEMGPGEVRVLLPESAPRALLFYKGVGFRVWEKSYFGAREFLDLRKSLETQS